MKNTYVSLIAMTLIGAAVGFGGGVKYQQTKTPSFGGNQSGRFFATQGATGSTNGGNRQFGGRGIGARPVSGEILKSDDASITVKMPDGSTKIVLLSEKTSITTATEVQKNELKTGSTVLVFGTENQDGSVAAASIQLNPQLRMMGAPQEATPSPTKK